MKRDIQSYIRKQPTQKLDKEDQIRIILEEFDFSLVNAVMTFLNWHWWRNDPNPGSPPIDRGVPTIDMLKENARYCLERVWNLPETDSHNYETGTGGFVATKSVYDGLKMLSLRFELTSWELDYDNVQNENYS